jgi:hypothetical protein
MSQIHGAKGQQSQRKYDKHKMEEKKRDHASHFDTIGLLTCAAGFETFRLPIIGNLKACKMPMMTVSRIYKSSILGIPT